MPETPTERTFDPEAFRADLVEKTNVYAVKAYGEDRKKPEIAVLYQELLNACADALLTTGHPDLTMEVIRIQLADYRYGNGYDLFGGSSKTEFYHDLALRIAQRRP